jgi:hypothetical protein
MGRGPAGRPFAPYNQLVARGWESKSVEEQQAAANDTSAKPKPRLTSEQKVAECRKEGLRLSRSRIIQQIDAATNPRYREILTQALANLDDQIRALD